MRAERPAFSPFLDIQLQVEGIRLGVFLAITLWYDLGVLPSMVPRERRLKFRVHHVRTGSLGMPGSVAIQSGVVLQGVGSGDMPGSASIYAASKCHGGMDARHGKGGQCCHLRRRWSGAARMVRKERHLRMGTDQCLEGQGNNPVSQCTGVICRASVPREWT